MGSALSTGIICSILVLIGVFSIRSFIKKMKNGCCGAGGSEVKRIRPADRELSHYPYSRRIQIEGMSCKNCALRIANAFHEQEGFYAEVNLKGNFAIVRTKQPVSDEELRSIVRRSGYEAVCVGPSDL